MRFMSVCAVLAIGCLTALGAENDSAGAEASSSPNSARRERENGVPLTLQEAIHRALAENPGLAAKRWDVEISGAEVTQAGLRPNPELSIEMEDIRWNRGPTQHTRSRSLAGGLGSGSLPTLGWESETESGSHSGLTEAEVTLSIAQLIELGGKRAKRVAEAEEAKQLALWDYEALRARVSSNPDIARWAAELAARKATLELARANRIPDATVELGLRSAGLADSAASHYGLGTDGGFSASRSKTSFDSGRDNALQLKFSIPLPIFHRNQGEIAAAQFSVSQIPDSNRAAAMRVHSDLAAAHEEAASAFSEVLALRKNVLPRSAEIFEKTQTGYRQGKFDYLDLLDSQRTLFEVRTAYLTALERGHLAVIALERLTGTALAQYNTASLHDMEETEDAH